MIAGMASRANEDDRPAVVLYFSDFDPTGHQMPAHVSRKLQALRLLKYPDLDIQVHHVALTFEQVVDLDLPSSPLRDTELRSDDWRAAHGGREQTEIDALCALRPEILDRIIEDALAPFRDTTLRRRAQEARSRAEMEMNRHLRAHPIYQTVCESIIGAHGDVAAAIDRLHQCQREGEEALAGLGRVEIETVEAEIEVYPPEPLFDSEDDYTTATRRLINHKKLNGEGSA